MVHHIEVAQRCINRDANGVIKCCGSSRAIGPGCSAAPSKRAHCIRSTAAHGIGKCADEVVARVRDVYFNHRDVGVDCNASGRKKGRGGARPAICASRSASSASNGCNCTNRTHVADDMIASVNNKPVTRPINRHPGGAIERGNCTDAVTGSSPSRAAERGHRKTGGHLPYSIVSTVTHPQNGRL